MSPSTRAKANDVAVRIRMRLSPALAALRRGAICAWLLALALAERPRTAWRRLRHRQPRLIWGPVPIISLKFWSIGMRNRGYESLTAVSHHYAINRREDFDVYRDGFPSDYRFFVWALRNGDVFLRFLDGGFLRDTPLRWWEGRLLRIAGKKLVVIPYGSDIAVGGELGELEERLFRDYPALAENSEMTRRWVDHSIRWANLVVRHHQPGYLPRWDATLPNHFAIDVEPLGPAPAYSEADGHTAPVTVIHAPNHRNVKGSDHLIRAVEELREGGLKVELQLLEGRPNSEIRAAIASADIAADQFLSPGYAMFSIEAMGIGRPVLNSIGNLPADLLATEVLRECPAVDTNPARLQEDVRRLVEDPELRREIGLAGRRFVARYHSIDALATEWEALIGHVWAGEPIPERLLPER